MSKTLLPKLLALLLLLFPHATGAADKGSVSVLYAGSLGGLMEKSVGPAFERATGYRYQGEGQGSVAAARAIRDRLREPDVFLSADPAVNAMLMAPGNGFEDWYLTFAAGELVLGYNPRSRFRDLFEQARTGKIPWYEVLARPGVRLGRTDPNLDPKGYRTLFLFHLAEQHYKKPGLAALLGPPANPDQIYPEPELLIRMESGQLDAAVFYKHEVIAHGMPYIVLPGEINQGDPRLAPLYAGQTFTTDKGMKVVGAPILFTIAILRHSRNPAGGTALVRFLLSPQGRAMLEQAGLRATPVLLSGDESRLPPELKLLLQGRYTP